MATGTPPDSAPPALIFIMCANRPGMVPQAPRVALLLAALLVAVALAGCSSSTSGGDGSGSGTGSASAYVKDARSDDFKEVHIVFTQVSVHRSADGNGTSNTTATGTATGVSTTVGNTTVSASATASATASGSAAPEAGWIVVFSDAAGVDVDLMNTTAPRPPSSARPTSPPATTIRSA